MSTIAEDIIAQIEANGGSFRVHSQVNLLTVKRTLLSWVSKNIQHAIGVPVKPTGGSVCPVCEKQKQYFELDHQGPWRVYVAATGGGHITNGPHGELFIDRATLKALYNDPDNLWWICKDCNSAKSDKTYDSQAQLVALQSGIIPDGQKSVDPAKVFGGV